MLKSVLVDEKELMQLRKDQTKLKALENAGVESWTWYGQAMKEIHREEAFDRLIEDTVENILEECSVEAEVDYPSCREAGPSVNFSVDTADRITKWLREFSLKAGEI